MAALRQCMSVATRLAPRTVFQTRQATCATRAMSSGASDRIVIDMDSTKGVATMKFNKPPVNSLNLEFLQDICNNVEMLEKDKGCRGVIITSNKPGIFSAGLDIMEMYQPNAERLREFWTYVQEMWIRLYGCKLITMTAINGHSPAGGCLISLCSDYRVMAEGKFTIGLNETQLGIVAPTWFQATMKNTVGQRETERGLQLGLLYSGEEALKIGMIDKLVPMEDVMSTTQAEMDKWLKIPDFARSTSKLQMRKATIDTLVNTRKEDVEFFMKFITGPAVQKGIGMYLEALKKKAAAAAAKK